MSERHRPRYFVNNGVDGETDAERARILSVTGRAIESEEKNEDMWVELIAYESSSEGLWQFAGSDGGSIQEYGFEGEPMIDVCIPVYSETPEDAIDSEYEDHGQS